MAGNKKPSRVPGVLATVPGFAACVVYGSDSGGGGAGMSVLRRGPIRRETLRDSRIRRPVAVPKWIILCRDKKIFKKIFLKNFLVFGCSDFFRNTGRRLDDGVRGIEAKIGDESNGFGSKGPDGRKVHDVTNGRYIN